MTTVKVLIDSVQKVKEFSSIVSKSETECELVEGPRILDAKSIMGIFSLDLSGPIELRMHSDNPELVKALKKFIV